jgi:hypothetical protein
MLSEVTATAALSAISGLPYEVSLFARNYTNGYGKEYSRRFKI